MTAVHQKSYLSLVANASYLPRHWFACTRSYGVVLEPNQCVHTFQLPLTNQATAAMPRQAPSANQQNKHKFLRLFRFPSSVSHSRNTEQQDGSYSPSSGIRRHHTHHHGLFKRAETDPLSEASVNSDDAHHHHQQHHQQANQNTWTASSTQGKDKSLFTSTSAGNMGNVHQVSRPF